MPQILIPTWDPDIIIGRDPAKSTPKKAVAIEVDLSFDPASKKATLQIIKVAKSSGNFSDHADFLKWAKGQVVSPTWGRKVGFNPTKGKRKPTKMSLKYKDPFYLFVKLSDNLNWRFAADGAPLSMDRYWRNKEVFFDSFSFDDHGDIVPNPSTATTCKHAYTIVNCDKAKETPGSDDFEARFNLHVDLVENPTDLVNSSYIPIILDPDVRWPGGDGP
ncbi:MAG: nucleotide synthetase [Parasphingorhabdus sp.]|uniref:nucleotide synthetase n=1 Tax=Parasphingorhabdus sp. TaxID=2709688 RepID=UPI003296BD81